MAPKEKDLIPLLARLHAEAYEEQRSADRGASGQSVRRPFATISRQAGAGGRTFARMLVDRLNERDPAELPWTVWDNELVEKVAAEHRLPAESVASLQEAQPSWLEETLAGLTLGDWREHPSELAVYRRVALTIRALADIGRVVIVGRGGAFITRDMPGGVHLRLVAPLEDRVATAAKTLGAPANLDAARAWVREKDQAREAFYRRYWPNRPLVLENFTAAFNTAAAPMELLIECVVPLVVAPRVAAAPAHQREAR